MAMELNIGLDVSDVAPTRVLDSLSRLLHENTLVSIACVLETGAPHINTCFYAYTSSLDMFVLTPPKTMHATTWAQHPSVAITIFDSHQVSGAELQGLQLFGNARLAEGAVAETALKEYGSRYPAFADAAPDIKALLSMFESRFYVLEISRFKLFDEKSFGKEVWIEASIVR